MSGIYRRFLCRYRISLPFMRAKLDLRSTNVFSCFNVRHLLIGNKRLYIEGWVWLQANMKHMKKGRKLKNIFKDSPLSVFCPIHQKKDEWVRPTFWGQAEGKEKQKNTHIKNYFVKHIFNFWYTSTFNSRGIVTNWPGLKKACNFHQIEKDKMLIWESIQCNKLTNVTFTSSLSSVIIKKRKGLLCKKKLVHICIENLQV